MMYGTSVSTEQVFSYDREEEEKSQNRQRNVTQNKTLIVSSVLFLSQIKILKQQATTPRK